MSKSWFNKQTTILLLNYPIRFFIVVSRPEGGQELPFIEDWASVYDWKSTERTLAAPSASTWNAFSLSLTAYRDREKTWVSELEHNYAAHAWTISKIFKTKPAASERYGTGANWAICRMVSRVRVAPCRTFSTIFSFGWPRILRSILSIIKCLWMGEGKCGAGHKANRLWRTPWQQH